MRKTLLCFLALLAPVFGSARGQEFVQLKTRMPEAFRDDEIKKAKDNGKSIKLQAYDVVTVAYPGETRQFLVADSDTYYALKWQSLTPAVATILDDSGGIIEFQQVGSAVFKIDVFNKKKSVPMVVYAIIDCKPSGLKLDANIEKCTYVGGTFNLAPKLTKGKGEEPANPRSISVSVQNPSILQLSDDEGRTWKSNTKVMPGVTLIVRALAKGKSLIHVQSAGFSRSEQVEVVQPVIRLKVSNSDFYQGGSVVVKADVVGNDDDGPVLSQFTPKIEVTGGASITGDGLERNIEFPRQGHIKVKASVTSGGVAIESKTLEFDVIPKVATVRVNSMRKVILNGDTIAVDLTAFDTQDAPIERKARGTLKAKLFKKIGENPENWEEIFGIRTIVKDDKDYIKFDRLADPRGSYRVTLYLEAPTGTASQCIKDVHFRDDVEVVARLVNDGGLGDLFSPQVAREFYVYELTATSFRSLAEDPELAKGSTIHLYGASLRLPSTIVNPKLIECKDNRGLRPAGGGRTEPEEFKESSQLEIADFAAGNRGTINMFLSPYYSERFDKVKDAVAYRDPAFRIQRFIETAVKIANFLQVAYPNAHSQPFHSTDDITRLDQAKQVTDFIFNEYKNELSKKGKVTSSDMLREITKVAKDQPTVVYFLVRKDAWRQVNGNTGLQVTMFPVGSVQISYAVVSDTSTTLAGKNANGG